MKTPKRILFDWGGTIVRDDELFERISKRSGVNNPVFESPESWDHIRAGTENHFDQIAESFFALAEPYESAFDVINFFSKDEYAYVVYDNRPHLGLPVQRTELLFGKTLVRRKESLRPKGIFIDADKVSLCKRQGIDIAVDDDPRIALALASAGVETILISRLWNRSFNLDDLSLYVPQKKKDIIQKNLFFVEDWHGVKNQINKLI